MKITVKTLLLAASLALASGFQSHAIAADMSSAEQAIAAAKEARKQASSVGGEWRDTGKLLKKADKLLKEGKYAEAVDMAEAAEIQAMLGYMQATSQTLDKLHI